MKQPPSPAHLTDWHMRCSGRAANLVHSPELRYHIPDWQQMAGYFTAQNPPRPAPDALRRFTSLCLNRADELTPYPKREACIVDFRLMAEFWQSLEPGSPLEQGLLL